MLLEVRQAMISLVVNQNKKILLSFSVSFFSTGHSLTPAEKKNQLSGCKARAATVPVCYGRADVLPLTWEPSIHQDAAINGWRKELNAPPLVFQGLTEEEDNEDLALQTFSITPSGPLTKGRNSPVLFIHTFLWPLLWLTVQLFALPQTPRIYLLPFHQLYPC